MKFFPDSPDMLSKVFTQHFPNELKQKMEHYIPTRTELYFLLTLTAMGKLLGHGITKVMWLSMYFGLNKQCSAIEQSTENVLANKVAFNTCIFAMAFWMLCKHKNIPEDERGALIFASTLLMSGHIGNFIRIWDTPELSCYTSNSPFN